MDDDPSTLPDNIPPRFHLPPGWRWEYFTNREGKRLRCGMVFPAQPPRAIVVGLQGLSEFTEKYFETAQDMLDRGFAFCMMDWQGQGRSYRPLRNPQKRWTRSFDADIADFSLFMERHILPRASRTDGASVPLVMLAHSMGGNIGLRYLQAYPGIFSAAVFSSPFIGVLALRAWPRWLAWLATRALGRLAGRRYMLGGPGDWRAERQRPHTPFLSSDPIRSGMQRTWYIHAPELQVGDITYGWLDAACVSCRTIRRGNRKKPIPIPCLFALAGREDLVDNLVTRALAAAMPHAKVEEIEGSGHEILMESDAVRERFFAALDDFLAQDAAIVPLKRREE